MNTRATSKSAKSANSAATSGQARSGPTIYLACSFRHIHAVRLLGRELKAMGYEILDWTKKATPPEGLSPAERRAWMDTDHGGEVYIFCEQACREADFVIYLGTSGQDAGVEVGLAKGSGVPVLCIRGPLEAPGLMLYGAGSVWLESIEEALDLLGEIKQWAKIAQADGPLADMPPTVQAMLKKFLHKKGSQGERPEQTIHEM